jgi:hypothetical protein
MSRENAVLRTAANYSAGYYRRAVAALFCWKSALRSDKR